jgi:hypothetical protein
MRKLREFEPIPYQTSKIRYLLQKDFSKEMDNLACQVKTTALLSCSSFKSDCQELPNPCGAIILSTTNTQFKGVTAYHQQLWAVMVSKKNWIPFYREYPDSLKSQLTVSELTYHRPSIR